MPKALAIRPKTVGIYKPLVEGEPYCSCCICHVDSCQCLVIEEIEVSQEQYDELYVGIIAEVT